MPITKIPIVHKFGIISHSQRLELQERLLKQSYLQTLKSHKVALPTRNPLEVSEDFVQQYNSATSLNERERYEEDARKMLERSKRRAGVRDGGNGQHVNLPLAWTELAQLAQCKGKIQEECLDVLITSLDQSPLEKYHIPALFFLAETMLYWLRTDAVHQPYLRTGEIKLLKMGQLVFTRLFYHHMAGQLQGQQEFKNRLFTYLDGLTDCQEAYSPYPNALLSLRFIITVGKIIMGDTQLEPGDIKEGDNVDLVKSPLSRPSVYSQGGETKRSSHRGDETYTSHSGAISSSVHDLSPTLWHALDVWRCTNHLSGGLTDALTALSHCGMGLVNENWVDSMIALQILAEAAKSNLNATKVLHNMARGVRPQDTSQTPPVSSHSESSEMYSLSSEDSPKGRESRTSGLSSKPTLSDIYERSEEGGDSERRGKSSKGSKGTTHFDDDDSPQSELQNLQEENGGNEQQEFRPKPALKDGNYQGKSQGEPREVSFGTLATLSKSQQMETLKITQDPDRLPTQGTQGSRLTQFSFTDTLPPGTGWRAEAGTDLPSGRASDASSVQTFTNQPAADSPGINGWHWEVAITYTDILADICLHGATANIQKMALMGNNSEVVQPFKQNMKMIPMSSAGLIDLAFFRAVNETRDGGPNDWSWRIRFGAIQSMVKVCRSLANDKNREGLRTAAWNILLRTHSLEKDDRVLEALKVGQVHTDIETLLNKQLQMHPFTLGAKVAAGLSVIYLPPLPPPVDPYIPPPSRKTKSPVLPVPREPSKAKTNRTSLKEEIMLATALYEPPVDFNKRTSYDLRRIIEDQWRKDLQKQQEEAEKERQREIQERQKEEDKLQKEIAENRAKKFSKSKKEDKNAEIFQDT